MINSEEILVLKEVRYKENDKILHAISKNKGLIQLISRGCKKNNSPLINVSQTFVHAKCELFKSKDMYVITSADLIDNFYYLRNNMEAFLYGSYILELIHYIASENMVDNKIFDMTVEILKNLSSFNKDFDKLVAAYELKLAAMLGYKPDFYHCLYCSNDIKTDVVLSIEEGGFYCSKCVNNGNGINVLFNEILTLRKILKIKFKDINTVDNINSKVINLIRKFLFYHIGKNNFITLKLLNNG